MPLDLLRNKKIIYSITKTNDIKIIQVKQATLFRMTHAV